LAPFVVFLQACLRRGRFNYKCTALWCLNVCDVHAIAARRLPRLGGVLFLVHAVRLCFLGSEISAQACGCIVSLFCGNSGFVHSDCDAYLARSMFWFCVVGPQVGRQYDMRGGTLWVLRRILAVSDGVVGYKVCDLEKRHIAVDSPCSPEIIACFKVRWLFYLAIYFGG
jgi:hypothetical protein